MKHASHRSHMLMYPRILVGLQAGSLGGLGARHEAVEEELEAKVVMAMAKTQMPNKVFTMPVWI